MMLKVCVTLLVSTLLSTVNSVSPPVLVERASSTASKYVIAHFMVGIVPNYGVADWKQDISYAQDTGIDAFALNCAPTRVDYYTPNQLANAYEAARQMNFKLLISFDFAYWNSGDTAEITRFMNLYANHTAQLMYNGSAMVSTFVGDSFDWAPVKASTKSKKLFAIPNHTDPRGSSYQNTQFDGVFSWYAWPTSGNNQPTLAPMTTFWDDIFLTSLAGRPYMAPVSPWFSPHFANKNWVFICEQLITERWNQILKMKPDLLEIISWNDYGEGHYVAPWQPNHSDDGSSQWTLGFPHDGWRTIMKPYIAAYKVGASVPTVTKDQLVYWYRPTPKNTVCTGDPVGPSDGYQMLSDSIFITTMLTKPATLIVTSGTKAPVSINVPAGIVTSNVTMGVGGQFFYLKRDGATIMSGLGGRVVTDKCQFYNFNAYVGTLDTSNSIGPAPSVTSTQGTPTTTSTRSQTPATTRTTTTKPTVQTTPTKTTARTTTKTPTTSPKTTTKAPSSTTNKSTTTASKTTTRRKAKKRHPKPKATQPPISTPTASTPVGAVKVCSAGSGDGNYIGLCAFACSFGYCPPGPCSCTEFVESTAARQPPTDTGRRGLRLTYLDDSYAGLCAFACARDYCPPTACYYG